jgi:hypothetical protein
MSHQKDMGDFTYRSTQVALMEGKPASLINDR